MTDKASTSRQRKWAVMVSCLTLIALLSFSNTGFAIYLFAAHLADTPISSTEALSLTASVLSLGYVAVHALAISRKDRASANVQENKMQSVLESGCFVLLRLMVVVWFGAAAVGSSIFLNQPLCRPASSGGQFWQQGSSCMIHRVSAAFSVMAFISTCALIIVLELSPNAFSRRIPVDDEESLQDALSKENLLRHSSLPDIPGAFDISTPFTVSSTLPKDPSRASSWGASWGASWTSYVKAIPKTEGPSATEHPTNPSPSISECTLSSQHGTVCRKSISSAASSMRNTYRRSRLSSMRRADNPDILVLPDVLRPASRKRLPSSWMCDSGASEAQTETKESKSSDINIVTGEVSNSSGATEGHKIESESDEVSKSDVSGGSISEIDSDAEIGRLEALSPAKTLNRSKAISSGVHRMNATSSKLVLPSQDC